MIQRLLGRERQNYRRVKKSSCARTRVMFSREEEQREMTGREQTHSPYPPLYKNSSIRVEVHQCIGLKWMAWAIWGGRTRHLLHPTASIRRTLVIISDINSAKSKYMHIGAVVEGGRPFLTELHSLNDPV